MLTTSSARFLRCPLGIVYHLDTTAKTVLRALILKTNPTDKFMNQQDPEYICKVKDWILVESFHLNFNKVKA